MYFSYHENIIVIWKYINIILCLKRLNNVCSQYRAIIRLSHDLHKIRLKYIRRQLDRLYVAVFGKTY